MQEIVDFSVITRALQGDCLKPDEKHGLERLSRAMAKKGYCAIALGDNDTARDIRCGYTIRDPIDRV